MNSSKMADSWDVYVVFRQRRGNDPLHWMLLLSIPGSLYCTWYHIVGGPTENRAYERKIEAGKRIDSYSISKRQYVGKISAWNINKAKSEIVAVPIQESQCWTVEVLAALERKSLVPASTSVYYYNQMEPSIRETEDGWVLLSGTLEEELTIE